MENIYKYEEFINENTFDDFKQKIVKWWSSFQNKEDLYRNLKKYISNGFWIMVFIYIIGVLLKINPSLKTFIENNEIDKIFIYMYSLMMLLDISKSTFLNKIRKKTIHKKMEELRNIYKDDIYAIIGSSKNINSFLSQLKLDGVLEEHHILQTDDITLVDFSGGFQKRYVKINEIDPYGEEDWGESEEYTETPREAYYEYRINAYRQDVISHLERKYNVTFRKIITIKDIFDGSMSRGKHNEESYMKSLRSFKRYQDNEP